MTKLLTAAAALATLLAPAAAFAADSDGARSFTRDGETYVYTTTQKKDRTILTGHRLPSGTPFALTVRGRNVSGIANGVSVNFPVPAARAATREVASN